MIIKKHAEKHGDCYVGSFLQLNRNSEFVHGFTTRKGGVSQPPFDSFNIGFNTSDNTDSISINRERFISTLGLQVTQLAIPQQDHGDRILYAADPGDYPETDALITDVAGVALTVQVADCVPVFLADPGRPAIGLVHAGWRGSALNITFKTVRKMKNELGCDVSRMIACIGPSIGPCCYEIGDEVREAFNIDTGTLNLWEVQKRQLMDAGIPETNIECASICTSCHSDWFFSHRASGGLTGRMMGAIMIR